MNTRSIPAPLTLLLVLLASAACGRGSGGSPSPTPGASATVPSPSPETSRTVVLATPEASSTPHSGCELETAACQFVADIAGYVAAGDASAIVALVEPRMYNCPGEITGLGGPFPLCDGQPRGTELPGVFYTIPQVGLVLSAEQLHARLTDAFESARPTVSDANGDGSPRVVSYAYLSPDPRHRASVAAVLTWIAPATDAVGIDPATGTRRFVAAIVGTPSANGDYRVTEYSRSLDLGDPLGPEDLLFAGGVAPAIPRFGGYTFRPWK